MRRDQLIGDLLATRWHRLDADEMAASAMEFPRQLLNFVGGDRGALEELEQVVN